MLLNPGSVLGDRYEIIEKIGSGGMAVVYRGKDKKLDRYVTIKVLREEFIGDEEFIERFRSEACSAARLSHPNIVRVYDVGEDGEINYIVMEYIHGDTLKTAIRKKAPFDSRSTINVAIQIASALSQAHKAHIVHRDIKPQNILVGTDGVVKVTDFGIARAARATTMTTTANAAGSVHYFSPEQARGGYVDEKSDIYSLGITMFEMITGVLPFQGNNSVSIALKHINEELPDIRQYNPNCTPSLEGIIKKATMKKADERYASIDLLLADLMRARTEVAMHAEQERQTEPKERSHAAVAGAAGTAAGAAAGIRMSRRAEAAKELREAQERAEAERARIRKMEDEAVTAESPLVHRRAESGSHFRENIPAMENAEEATRKADENEIDLIRFKKNEEAPAAEEPEVEGDVNTPLVSFEKYGKRLKISKDDHYEGEYMAVEEVKKSRRPERKRRNPRKEEEYDNERDRKAERRVIAAAIVTAIVLIVIISTVGLRVLGGIKGIGSGEKNIETPTFIGMTYEEAEREAEKLGLKLVKEGEDYSSYYDAGQIFWQNVDPETMVANNTKIGVKVSIGLQEQEMPDVLNKSEKDAKEAIIKLVGTSPDIVYEESEDVKPGHVISQDPVEGTKIDAHTHITLTVCKPEEGGEVVVPDVQGDTENSAVQSLEAVGLKVGNISYLESSTVPEGKVITQTLTPDSKVPSGSIVNLVISKGAPKQEEPEEEEPPREGGSGEPADSNSTSTQYFTITAPEGAADVVHVKVVKTDANGTTTIVDEPRNLSDFPFSIAVTGTGSGTVTGTVDGQTTLSENVTF
ncbi:protein kinase domain-containing protein [Anaerotignum sp.]|uniref:protein kinase domain-containing protein n=2 Tax=Anaerotignum sp. TaxID=2039241 RepID=UPI002A915E68|nr:protein kinase [Anaerotignum sp.]MCI7656986.1 protein kinase [Clostridia bacterium]MDY5414822.1 protein kinase [Anaerotignum sp.]